MSERRHIAGNCIRRPFDELCEVQQKRGFELVLERGNGLRPQTEAPDMIKSRLHQHADTRPTGERRAVIRSSAPHSGNRLPIDSSGSRYFRPALKLPGEFHIPTSLDQVDDRLARAIGFQVMIL